MLMRFLELILVSLVTAVTMGLDPLPYQLWKVDVNRFPKVKTQLQVSERQGEIDIFSVSKDNVVFFMVTTENNALMQRRFSRFQPEVVVEDLQSKLPSRIRRSHQNTNEFDFEGYHNLDKIYERLTTLASLKSDIAEVATFGKTFQGRDLQYIRITSNISNTNSSNKPILWIDGGIHAREWIAPATVMFIIETLLGTRESNATNKIQAYRDEFQFYIVPVLNPDGYVYSHTSFRLWRKNRVPGCLKNKKMWFGNCYLKACYGVDLNRNWPDGFGGSSTSPFRCSIIYPGQKPFDQPESAAVRNILHELKQNTTVALYLSYHSYSQLFLTPYGFTDDKLPPHYQHHKEMGDKVVDAIYRRHGKNYTNQRAAELYPAGGVSGDWAYNSLGVIDSYTFELRPDGSSDVGFLLPPEEILATGEENVDGLFAIMENLYYHQNKDSNDGDSSR